MANGQATDDFNRADASPISGNWVTVGGGGTSPQIVGQEVRPVNVGGGGDVSLYTLTYNNEQTSRVDVITLNSGGSARALCRGSTAAYTYYFFWADGPFSGSVNCVLAKQVTGSFSVLGSGSTASLATTGTVACDVNATTTVRGLVNGSQIYSVTDTAIAAGYMGIGAFCTSAVTEVEIDNWQGDYVFDQDAPTTAVSIGACSIVGMT